jgi:hypothetical protein
VAVRAGFGFARDGVGEARNLLSPDREVWVDVQKHLFPLCRRLGRSSRFWSGAPKPGRFLQRHNAAKLQDLIETEEVLQ